MIQNQHVDQRKEEDPRRACDWLADTLVRSLLTPGRANPVRSRAVKHQRIEQVFRTRTTVYLHYTIENNSGRPYRVNTPEAYLLQTDAPSISVSSLVRTQLNQAVFEELGNTRELPLRVAHAESVSEDLQPGERHDWLVDFYMQNPRERLCDALLRLVEDPLKPRDEHSRFRVNPILVLLVTIFALVLGTFLFFSLVQS